MSLTSLSLSLSRPTPPLPRLRCPPPSPFSSLCTRCVLTRSQTRSIEDNLLITEDGCENLTDLVKDPEELEKIVSGSA